MKKYCAWILSLLLFYSCKNNTSNVTPIRIGWQQAWATQGQIAQTLMKTDILSKNGLEGNFIGFTYGAPLAEAAVNGQLDVAFVADQPMFNIISKTKNWTIVGRLNNFRTVFLTQPNSKINSVEDFKGKVFAVPFGSTSHRTALKLFDSLGLVPGKDLVLKNLDISEMSSLVEAETNKDTWSGIDVIIAWDPTAAILEEKGLVKIIHSELETAVVGMNNNFIKDNPLAAKGFLKSYVEAIYYYSQNKKQANTWFSEGAKRDFSDSLLNKIASIEPFVNVDTINQINISFNSDQIRVLNDNVKKAYEAKLIPEYFDISGFIDTTFIPNFKER